VEMLQAKNHYKARHRRQQEAKIDAF
jgi:hypothetical protein